jgi:transcriptional regulator with XRE-family HTH domain
MTLEQLLKSIGRRIAKIRLDRSLTQRVLSKESGVAYRYLQTIESGRANVTLATLYRLSTFLQVPVKELFLPEEGEHQT